MDYETNEQQNKTKATHKCIEQIGGYWTGSRIGRVQHDQRGQLCSVGCLGVYAVVYTEMNYTVGFPRWH